jgi:phage recombination protein Bet
MENKDLVNYNDSKLIETLKSTVAQGLTDPEFRLFTEFCKSTGLNPFKKEIWAIKAGGRLQLMTGINGYLSIANSHPQFDGMEVDVELLNGKPMKAVAKVYRKDRKYPSVGIALMSEFGKSTPVWSQMPSVMLTKVAKSIALREAFTQELGGLYTEEEMPSQYEQRETHKVSPPPPVKAVMLTKLDAPLYYQIPNDVLKTINPQFLIKREVKQDAELDVFISYYDLGPRLKEYQIDAKLLPQKSDSIDYEAMFEDTIEEKTTADEVVEETPLQKAQKRAKEMRK